MLEKMYNESIILKLQANKIFNRFVQQSETEILVQAEIIINYPYREIFKTNLVSMDSLKIAFS